MKVLIFSDLHLHTWKYGSTVTPSGYNSRLLSQVSVLDQIDKCATKEGIDTIIFCGDLFHTHSSIPTQALDAATVAFTKLGKDRNLFVLVGNHDISNKKGNIHSLRWIHNTEIGVVIDRSATLVSHSETFHFLSYTDDENELKAFLKATPKDATIFMHQGVAGVPMGSGFVINEILKPDMLDDVSCKHAFTGHYHTHKRVTDKLTVIGSPMQHTWGDVGVEKGWLVYDTDTGQVTIWNSIAPEFRIIDYGNCYFDGEFPPHVPIENNFIRLINMNGDREAARAKLKELGAAEVEFTLSNAVSDSLDIEVEESGFDIAPLIDAYEKSDIPETRKLIGREVRQGIEYETQASKS